jgi:uncharacterized protein YjbI with pentapeptide repeats
MTNRNYSNRNLQNFSFKGQDLTGADFSGSDLRGCNFIGTTLIAANFQKVTTGQSPRQFHILVAATIISSFVLLGLSFIVAQFSVVWLRDRSDNHFIRALPILALLLQIFIRDRITLLFPKLTSFLGILAMNVLFVLMVVMTLGLTFVSFSGFMNGEVIQGFFLFILMVIFALLTFQIFLWLIESIQSHNGTSFRKANLTDIDFSHAEINNTDFSHAVLTGACIFNCVMNTHIEFAHVYCQYLYLEPTHQNRQPPQGDFKPGELELLLTKFIK